MWSIKFVVMVCMTSAFCLTFSLSRGRFFVGDMHHNKAMKPSKEPIRRQRKIIKKNTVFSQKLLKKKICFRPAMRLFFFVSRKISSSWFRPRAMVARAKLGASAQALGEEPWQVYYLMPHGVVGWESAEEERPLSGRATPPIPTVWTRICLVSDQMGNLPLSPHDRAPIGEADLKPESSDQPGDLPTYLPLPVFSLLPTPVIYSERPVSSA